MIKQDNVLRFNNLSQFDSLIHGFSTRFFGDMRPSHHLYPQSIKKFIETLGVLEQNLVRMDQVHSNTVALVTKENRGKVIDETDGLVSQDIDTFLGVVTADCIPLLFYDPKKKVTSAVHAGWRGLFSEIIKESVSQMISQGSKPENIFVGLGPCIRVCCYNIPQERVDMYLTKFPEWKPFIVERENKLFFDIPAVAVYQLRSLGVPAENIEDGDYCTFDHEDVYSARREGEGFGEMMGIIGLKNE